MPRKTDAELAAEFAALPDLPEPEPKPEPEDNYGLPLQTAAQLVAMVEKLFERVDRGEQGSAELLREVLAQHSTTLKQTLSPENKLHPDFSDYNPHGERDHPRKQLRRPCFFLGVPLEQPTLTYDEIELLNSITAPLEMPAPSGNGKWRVALLRDGGGGEACYISVPFKSFDDIRSLPEGWQGVIRKLQVGGTETLGQDSLLARIASLEAMVKSMAPTVTQ